MSTRNEVQQIDRQLTPILNSLLADARGEGLQSPYTVEIFKGSDGDRGQELLTFTAVQQNGEIKWDKNLYNGLKLFSGEEISIHVHGTRKAPVEGSMKFEFERSAEAD